MMAKAGLREGTGNEWSHFLHFCNIQSCWWVFLITQRYQLHNKKPYSLYEANVDYLVRQRLDVVFIPWWPHNTQLPCTDTLQGSAPASVLLSVQTSSSYTQTGRHNPNTQCRHLAWRSEILKYIIYPSMHLFHFQQYLCADCFYHDSR